MEGHDAAVANFVAITNTDEAYAIGLLESVGWNLENALNLHLASGRGGEGGPSFVHRAENEVAAALSPLSRSASGGGQGEEEDVRAPIPAKRQRLVDDGPPLGE